MKFSAVDQHQRGALVDARAAIDALSKGGSALLVWTMYEHENRLFFKDFSPWTRRGE